MRLGVNFCHCEHQPIGFNRDAVLALRPPIVRFVVTLDQVANMQAWIRAADAARLQVLWCLHETLTVATARSVARGIVDHGLHVTAGLEIGAAPWAFRCTPLGFTRLAFGIAQAVDRQPRTFTREWRPLLLGLGYDGSREAAAWLSAFARFAHIWLLFHGVAINATQPGRRWPRFRFRAVQARVMDQFGLPIAVTRVGWPLGQPFGWWTGWRELLRAASNLEETCAVAVTPAVRRRWLLDAYDQAERLGATHFILEPELVAAGGVNRWPLYDPIEQRADHAWHTLQWRTARAERPREVLAG